MNRLTSDQKTKVEQFISFTEASETKAIQTLKDNKWNLEVSVDVYFANPANKPEERVNTSSLDTLYKTYRDVTSSEDKISGENLQKLYKQVGADNELSELALTWKLKAKVLGEVSRQEFYDAMKLMRCDSVEKLKSEVERLKRDIQSEQTFREFYNGIFEFGKPANQKNQSLDMAIGLWEVVLPNRYKDLNLWFDFLRSKGHGISKDTWVLLLDFIKIANDDISKYDADSAWPSTIDEYVDYLSTHK